jgi:rhodanese-related sulfurtransferase
MRWFFGLWFVLACGGSDEAGSSPSSPAVNDGAKQATRGVRADVSMVDFVALHAQGAQVVDVRTPGEWSSGHVPGATHVPLGELHAQHPALLRFDKSKPMYFICQSGGRSARAADTMAGAGFHAVNVLGGTGAWVNAGHEVE